MPQPTEPIKSLRRARRKRERAQALREEANRELASAIAEARAAGVPVRSIAEEAGITVRSLYAIERGGGRFRA